MFKWFKKKDSNIKISKDKNMSPSKEMLKIDQMSGFEFEDYLAALYEKLGYKIIRTSKTGDYGADLIIVKDNSKTVIQAKRYGYGNKVGINAVNQVYAAISYYDATDGKVITNSEYTNQAQALANKIKVELIDRYELKTLLLQMECKNQGLVITESDLLKIRAKHQVQSKSSAVAEINIFNFMKDARRRKRKVKKMINLLSGKSIKRKFRRINRFLK